MAIGERIHFFRTLRGMTQKHLGRLLGFPEKSADVRLAQYEVGARKPKADLTAALAKALDVSPQALDVPDIDSDAGLMHTLFALDDTWGLEVCMCNGAAMRMESCFMVFFLLTVLIFPSRIRALDHAAASPDRYQSAHTARY